MNTDIACLSLPQSGGAAGGEGGAALRPPPDDVDLAAPLRWRCRAGHVFTGRLKQMETWLSRARRCPMCEALTCAHQVATLRGTTCVGLHFCAGGETLRAELKPYASSYARYYTQATFDRPEARPATPTIPLMEGDATGQRSQGGVLAVKWRCGVGHTWATFERLSAVGVAGLRLLNQSSDVSNHRSCPQCEFDQQQALLNSARMHCERAAARRRRRATIGRRRPRRPPPMTSDRPSMSARASSRAPTSPFPWRSSGSDATRRSTTRAAGGSCSRASCTPTVRHPARRRGLQARERDEPPPPWLALALLTRYNCMCMCMCASIDIRHMP